MDDERTEALEAKVAYLEHHVAQLDDLLRETVDRLGVLRRLMHDLAGRVERVDGIEFQGLAAERPPHHHGDPTG